MNNSRLKEVLLDHRQVDFIAWKCGVTFQEFLNAMGISMGGCTNGLPFRFFPLANYYCLYKCGYGLSDLIVLSGEYLEDREFFKVCYLKSHRAANDRQKRAYVSDAFINKHKLKPAFISHRPHRPDKPDNKFFRYWFRYDFYKIFGIPEMVDHLLAHPLRLWRLDNKEKGRISFYGLDNYVHSYRAAEAILNIHYHRLMRIEEGVLTPTKRELKSLTRYISKYGDLLEWKAKFDDILQTPLDLTIGEDSIPKNLRRYTYKPLPGDANKGRLWKLDDLGKKPNP